MAASSWCIYGAVPSLTSSSAETKNQGGIRLGTGCALRRSVWSIVRGCDGRRRGGKLRSGVFCMAPDEEKMTRRSPLDFPIEWERPKPGRRPDIFPQFSPMKTPLPTPLPADPPEEDEEEEEKKEEEEDPEKEEEENPDKPQSRMRRRT